MKYLCLAFMMVGTGCACAQTLSESDSTFEQYLPSASPSETNRVEFPAGYSIIVPAGWTARPIHLGDGFQRSLTDQIVFEGHVADEYPPRLVIQHLGPDQYALYHGRLRTAQSLTNGMERTQFQGQPALSSFLIGHGRGQTIPDSYPPCLMQSLFFERDGEGFILIFDIRSTNKAKPHYTRPLPVIEKYFETFRYKKPNK